jgi:FkbM family methyltransferase
LESVNRNTDFDWESLLQANYVALLSGRSGLGIIDVGGHAGRHSLAIQQQLNPSHLLIFEPLPDQRQSLETMFASNTNVSVYGLALGNWKGQSTFVVKKSALEESGLRQRSFYNNGNNDDLEHIPITIEKLDNLNIPFTVDYIKIDTEGGEIDILKGAANLLRRDAPIISVEYGPGGFDAYGYKPETLFELAGEMGYTIFDLFGNRFESMDEWRSCVGRFYWDYLLIADRNARALADRVKIIRALDFARYTPASAETMKNSIDPVNLEPQRLHVSQPTFAERMMNLLRGRRVQ